jgi:AraC-like DNA-binding protein
MFPTYEVGFDLGNYPRVRCLLPATWQTASLCLDQGLFYAVFSGHMQVTSRDKTHDMAAGSGCLIPPQTPFQARAKGGRVRLARFRLRGMPVGGMIQQWDQAWSLEPVITLVEDRLRQATMTTAEHQALAVLIAASLDRAGSPRSNEALRERLRIRIAADPHCTPSDLARELDLSPDYATRVIRAAVGVAPRSFILSERLDRAAERLMAGETWRHIANDLGWSDEKLFLRQFAKRFGEPPGRWRDRLA